MRYPREMAPVLISKVFPVCSSESAAFLIAARRAGPRPFTSARRAGLRSRTSSVSSPNFSTMSFAYFSPMPRTMPLARYRSMPRADVGATHSTAVASNSSPCVGCCFHEPTARISSPVQIVGQRPTSEAVSPPPGAPPSTATVATNQPVSSLWKTTLFTEPESDSVGAAGWRGTVGTAMGSNAAYPTRTPTPAQRALPASFLSARLSPSSRAAFP